MLLFSFSAALLLSFSSPPALCLIPSIPPSGPLIISLTTFAQLSKLLQGHVGWRPSRAAETVVLALPWALGVALASAVWARGDLGSYRGLYCFAHPPLDDLLTGGAMIISFSVCTGLTLFFYALTAWKLLDARTRRGMFPRVNRAVQFTRRTTAAFMQRSSVRSAGSSMNFGDSEPDDNDRAREVKAHCTTTADRTRDLHSLAHALHF